MYKMQMVRSLQAKNNINLTASDLQSQGSIAIKGTRPESSTVNVSHSDLSQQLTRDQIQNASSRDVGTQIQAKGTFRKSVATQIKVAH